MVETVGAIAKTLYPDLSVGEALKRLKEEDKERLMLIAKELIAREMAIKRNAFRHIHISTEGGGQEGEIVKGLAVLASLLSEAKEKKEEKREDEKTEGEDKKERNEKDEFLNQLADEIARELKEEGIFPSSKKWKDEFFLHLAQKLLSKKKEDLADDINFLNKIEKMVKLKLSEK
jgi:hypothetical protein